MFDLLSEVSIDLNASNSFIVISKGSSGPLRSSHDRYDPHLSVTLLAFILKPSVTIFGLVRYDPQPYFSRTYYSYTQRRLLLVLIHYLDIYPNYMLQP